ncbi:hypothetical protein BAUCODRAFT_213099 [Baudoinia panamericana UAMH 10762]|uniref:Zinc finger PHD-type domain-containing protein n=1 Tax=Baudoinia panamericana (strain UAMH 10762) TaxID=717646 RepID=M2LI54_BAUPA|nr:uncharacterized protein BAUCODRAFT_213099 [Baudoinia panamericana UAMH 10762]EMC93867.1 hypothetical protein BAUCODRAFT_213099 [Baudoinia panamericana UAMH 10762]
MRVLAHRHMSISIKSSHRSVPTTVMPSPIRRSARAAQPPPSKPPAPTSNSSTSSLSSRQDRNTKSTNAHQKSVTPHSLSSEEMSEPPRRSQRAQPTKEATTATGKEHSGGAGGDDEEVTRCICGQQEYPGPPLSEVFSNADTPGDDAGGLFIQCDGCSVWQHGGCVGIVEESQSPDKYYCEECRPKLHDQHTDSRGQPYSNYLPLHPQARRKSSVSKSDDKAKRERETTASRASADPVTGRRRATMRSKEHDDEEEQLQRALEESKKDVEPSGNGRKNGKSAKRNRDESEDVKPETKRQRTGSESLTSISRTATLDEDSDDDTTTASKLKRARAEAVQSARQAELREKEKEREKVRAEAAGRRQERAGRRRVDEAEDETPKPDVSSRSSPPASPLPASPPTFVAPDKPAQRKAPVKKTKKLGNNQYTKTHELSNMPSTSSPHSKKRHLVGGGHVSSGDEQAANGDSHQTTTSNSTNKNSPGAHEINGGMASIVKVTGKFGKGKHKAVNGLTKAAMDPQELSLTDMERNMDAMSAFMQRAQLDIAGDRTPPGVKMHLPGAEVGVAVRPPAPTSAGVIESRPFEQLSSMEMADVISRNIEKWKQRFGQPQVAQAA